MNEAGGRLKVIVSVMGLPHQLRWASYALEDGPRVCSRMATAPILLEALKEPGGSEVRLILVAPHSLIQLADGWEGLLREGNLEALTAAIERGAAASVADSLGEVAEWVRDDSPDLADVLCSLACRARGPRRDWIDVRVVQVKGRFPLAGREGTSVAYFSGDPTHAFVETYHALKGALGSGGGGDGGDVEIFVDMSHGWNFLSFLAYLGVAAFRDAHLPEARIRVRSSEPYSPLAECEAEELRASHALGGGGRPQVESKYPLGLIDVEPAASTLRLLRDSASLRAIPHLSFKFSNLLTTYSGALEEFGDGSSEAVNLARAVGLLRKVSCAIHAGLIPYLHWSLITLREHFGDLKASISKIEE
ncbi:MAG: hypothetical protein QI223_06050, partial [Candidatus Korarchaeota archaeon]|nr:hypothetical protein [Candidatus Korarchaeota archaeon]